MVLGTVLVCWILGEWIEPNARINELCGVTKGVDENVLQWFGHVEKWGIIGLLKG